MKSVRLFSFCNRMVTLVVAMAAYPSLGLTQERTMVELSSQQAQFEQRLMDRIAHALDPILGRENYSVGIELVTRPPQAAKEQQVSFTKLGLTKNLPTSYGYDTFKFTDWITQADVRLAYSANLKDTDEAKIQSLVENAIKGMGSFKYTVQISTFKPAKVSALSQPLPTSWSILGGGALLFMALLWLALQLRSLSFASGQSTQTPPQTNSYLSEYRDFDTGRNLGTASYAGTTQESHAKDGLQKWVSWLTTDRESARLFIERLGRSQDRSDNDLLAYLLQSTDTHLLRDLMRELNREVLSKARSVIGSDLDGTLATQLDQTLAKVVTQEILDQHLDSENIHKIIHDFTPEESVLAANKWPNLLALYVRFFAMNRVEQIVAQVDSQTFHDFLHKKEPSDLSWAKLASDARKFVLQLRQETSAKEVGPSKWIMVASHLDSEREKAFYDSMKYHKAVNEIVDYATENFPQFLMGVLPDEIMKPVLNSYPLNERAEIIYLIEKNEGLALAKLYQSAPKIFDLLTFELDQIKNQEYRSQLIESRSSQIMKNYVARLRKFIRSSPDNRTTARNLILNWGDGNHHDQASKVA